ncbi:MAG: hypothetical protein M1815_005673 [Lichina confinis]|nr:MAG: hypothetical protein M1815_005673 [Lichina confinis]
MDAEASVARTGAPSFTRTFTITVGLQQSLALNIHEPSITADNLGFKTWLSSFSLANRLKGFSSLLPWGSKKRLHALELGAGTGLLGMAAAAIWKDVDVHLTDASNIVENLKANVEANRQAISFARWGKRPPRNERDGWITTGVLDWEEESKDSSARPPAIPCSGKYDQVGHDRERDRYDVILAADTVYGAEHPRLMVEMFNKYLDIDNPHVLVIVEAVIRPGYTKESQEFSERMHNAGFCVLRDGGDTGYDDWGTPRHYELEAQDCDDRPNVVCSWAVWTRGSLDSENPTEMTR